MKGVKIVDSSPDVTIGSRADQYWKLKGWQNLFPEMRKGIGIPKNLSNDLSKVEKNFNLKGIGFGNWLNIEDKINYTYSLIYSFYDLNKVLRFNYNIGFGLLTVTFGARGRGTALAHYEPGNHFINITRYHEGKKDKKERFFATGGVGSLAHEYGHFLDYFAGEYLARDKELFALTNGRSIAKSRTGSKNKLRSLTDDIMEMIMWKIPGKEYSDYYGKMIEIVEKTNKGRYWIQRNEMFARAFEVYVAEKLRQQGIVNILLTEPKYSASVYLKSSEIQRMIPAFDKLLAAIRKDIK